MQFTIRIIVLAFLLVLFGCEGQPRKETYDLDISYTHEEIRILIEKELDARNIEYIRKDKHSLSYSSFNQTLVSNLSTEIIKEDLPSERSVSISSDYYLEKIEKAFKAKKIKYVVKYRHDAKWLVWAIEQKSEGKEIVDEILNF